MMDLTIGKHKKKKTVQNIRRLRDNNFAFRNEIGGIVMGIGLESSSYKYGLFHETCSRYELVTAKGDLIACSEVIIYSENIFKI